MRTSARVTSTSSIKGEVPGRCTIQTCVCAVHVELFQHVCVWTRGKPITTNTLHSQPARYLCVQQLTAVSCVRAVIISFAQSQSLETSNICPVCTINISRKIPKTPSGINYGLRRRNPDIPGVYRMNSHMYWMSGV